MCGLGHSISYGLTSVAKVPGKMKRKIKEKTRRMGGTLLLWWHKDIDKGDLERQEFQTFEKSSKAKVVFCSLLTIVLPGSLKFSQLLFLVLRQKVPLSVQVSAGIRSHPETRREKSAHHCIRAAISWEQQIWSYGWDICWQK